MQTIQSSVMRIKKVIPFLWCFYVRCFNQKLIKLPFSLLFSGSTSFDQYGISFSQSGIEKTGSYAKKVFVNLRNKERIMMPVHLN
jgi:hypothetical protein